MARPEWELLESTLKSHLACPRLDEVEASVVRLVDPAQRTNLDTVLSSYMLSYRDMVLIQLAYAVLNPGLDTTRRPNGARSMGQRLGVFFNENHVPFIADAYQNLGKNTPDLVRGNFQESDDFLQWASTAALNELEACFQYACAKVCIMARPVLPMPEVNVARLTFGAVMALYTEMLATPSAGAHEQFIVASLLSALAEQDGPASHHVETKQLNASDRSSSTAGDVQVVEGNRVIEAYEVTANDWRTKLDGLNQKLREHDLSRIHVVAPVSEGYGQVADELARYTDDFSVLNLSGFVATGTARLRRQYRAVALQRLYEYLDRYQESVERVNFYVTLLQRRGLTVGYPE